MNYYSQAIDILMSSNYEWKDVVVALAKVHPKMLVDIVQGTSKTEVDVILNDFGANKVAVIKAVRSVAGIGLRAAKELVESCPSSIKKGISVGEAEEIWRFMQEAGAAVEIK